MRPSKGAQLPPGDPLAQVEKTKAGVQAKVEHPSRYVKLLFGYGKVR